MTMSSKIILAITCMLLLVSCNRSTKQVLKDDDLEQSESSSINTGIVLQTHISPPPPGKVDSSDTIPVIIPEKVSHSNKIYEISEVDYLPFYPGEGWSSFAKYLQSVRYPQELKGKTLEGTFLAIVFVVEKDGTVSNIEIRKSVDPLVDEVVTKALMEMFGWKPGKKDGMYVRSKYGFTLIYG